MVDEPKTESKELTAEYFAARYQELVRETGLQLVYTPVWVPTNHNSFEIGIQVSIGKLPKENK